MDSSNGGFLVSSNEVVALSAIFFIAATARFVYFHAILRARFDHRIGQPKEHVELMPVLGQTAIPYFPMPE
jgi:hypothetical protein